VTFGWGLFTTLASGRVPFKGSDLRFRGLPLLNARPYTAIGQAVSSPPSALVGTGRRPRFRSGLKVAALVVSLVAPGSPSAAPPRRADLEDKGSRRGTRNADYFPGGLCRRGLPFNLPYKRPYKLLYNLPTKLLYNLPRPRGR
jgi:hypothetical protein